MTNLQLVQYFAKLLHYMKTYLYVVVNPFILIANIK